VSATLEAAALRRRMAGLGNRGAFPSDPKVAAFLDRQEAKMAQALAELSHVKHAIQLERDAARRGFVLPVYEGVLERHMPPLPLKKRLAAFGGPLKMLSPVDADADAAAAAAADLVIERAHAATPPAIGSGATAAAFSSPKHLPPLEHRRASLEPPPPSAFTPDPDYRAAQALRQTVLGAVAARSGASTLAVQAHLRGYRAPPARSVVPRERLAPFRPDRSLFRAPLAGHHATLAERPAGHHGGSPSPPPPPRHPR